MSTKDKIWQLLAVYYHDIRWTHVLMKRLHKSLAYSQFNISETYTGWKPNNNTVWKSLKSISHVLSFQEVTHKTSNMIRSFITINRIYIKG